jgi:hypothetical protein
MTRLVGSEMCIRDSTRNIRVFVVLVVSIRAFGATQPAIV